MSQNCDSSDDGQYATVLAAAAFAINSLEEAKLADEKKIREGLENFPTKARSKKEEGVTGQPDTGRISRKSTFKEWKADKKSSGIVFSWKCSAVKKSEKVDQRIPEHVVTSEKKPEKAPSRVPTTKRTPTFAEQLDTRPRPIPPPTAKPTLLAAGDDKRTKSSTRTGGPQSKADTWMEVEMAKIKKRYEKMNSTIQSWEDEKKKKARRRLDRKERELEQRRARVLQQHRTEMRRIDQIVGGAKAQVEEKRRNEQLKAKENANKIRATGKVPATCFCC
ncbi:remorin-like [Telopea speciosissima]|uniref:remorin-like n=1 Tax=Telopea speciosissima TaxID=54955 RepID=UPI001CC64653|nr:remorin-like [Telopea speciosissima]